MSPHYPFSPAPPCFADNALEPWIGAATIRLQRVHHLAGADRLNAILADLPAYQDLSVEQLEQAAPELPATLRPSLLDAAGVHANHQFWWKILKPGGNNGMEPSGGLRAALERGFGSVEGFRRRFAAIVSGHVGSGWAFLSLEPATGGLLAFALADNCSTLGLGRPGVMIFDLWEHAWCLDHGADRAAAIEAWWRVVDWAVLERRLESFVPAGRG